MWGEQELGLSVDFGCGSGSLGVAKFEAKSYKFEATYTNLNIWLIMVIIWLMIVNNMLRLMMVNYSVRGFQFIWIFAPVLIHLLDFPWNVDINKPAINWGPPRGYGKLAEIPSGHFPLWTAGRVWRMASPCKYFSGNITLWQNGHGKWWLNGKWMVKLERSTA